MNIIFLLMIVIVWGCWVYDEYQDDPEFFDDDDFLF